MAQKKVQYTYRARLVHLEVNGDLVTGDHGEIIAEDVEVHLSWPAKVTKGKSPRSADALRAAARMAVRSANRDALIKRHFDVERVDVVSSRSFPGR